MKSWGDKEFWGLGEEFDPDWLLTEAQKKLRAKLIEVCRTKIRPNAIQCDRTYQFPSESIKALGELGLLGLIIPKEMGGLGENHVCAAMVVETLARYGCSSTAMIFTMHTTSCSTLLFRYHKSPYLQLLIRRIAQEKLLGAISASDPATGGHDWYLLSSKVKYLNETMVQLLKFGSWVTSAGHADFYSLLTVSPTFEGSYENMCIFVVFKDEIRANTDDWSALGMHANLSGPVMVEGEFNTERMVGPPGDGSKNMIECIDVYFLLLSSSCWNGIAMGCLDLARRHLTSSTLADIGLRLCDYPTTQNVYGECMIDTTSARSTTFFLSQMIDSVSNNNDWTIYSDLNATPKSGKIHWCWQLKFTAAKNVANVAEKMLRVCGGTGYKTDLGLERLYRDGKAGWVMAPTNEVLANIVGLAALQGFTSIDLWEKTTNKRVVQREVKKMSPSQKEALGKQLLEEAARETSEEPPMFPYQDTDFVNPFNTAPPAPAPEEVKASDGVIHRAALQKDTWTPLTLKSSHPLAAKITAFTFSLPNPTDHTGCLPGQFVAVRLTVSGKHYLRYFSPVSRPDDYGRLEVVLKYETQGILSTFFKSLQPGSTVEFQGPCGGLEYKANDLDELTLLAGGAGVTPALQLARCLAHNTADKTRFTLIYYSDNLQDILYHEELEQLKELSRGQMQVVHTLHEAPQGWKGEEGFIDMDKIDRYVTKPNGQKHKVVICGGPTMSIACLFSLQQLGFPPQATYIYGQFGVEHVKAVYGRSAALSAHDTHTHM